MLCFIKHYFKIFILSLFILTNCKLQEPSQSHGIIFLENRAKKLELNKSNKNDVVRIIGLPQITDDTNEDMWIYLERVLTKGKYHELGRHKLKENNVLILRFDKFGILQFKEVVKKEKINKLTFSKKQTDNDFFQGSYIQSLLQSIKQKMYNNRRGTEF